MIREVMRLVQCTTQFTGGRNIEQTIVDRTAETSAVHFSRRIKFFFK